MDCPICFNIIKNSAVGPCNHHFCLSCLLKWCEFGGTQCPICKTLLTEIKYDREFDELINIINQDNNDENYPSLDDNNSIIVSFPNDSKAGVTICNNYAWFGSGKRGPGVVISKINNKYQCYQDGLREKDIILFINNIPCINHQQTIKIIDEICDNNGIMVCTIIKN